MDLNFFKEKFYGPTTMPLLPIQEQSWEDYIKYLYKSEVEKSGRSYVQDPYVDENIRMAAEWITSAYASCIMTGGVGIGKTVLMKALLRLFDSLRDPITIPPSRCRHVVYYDATELCGKYVASEDVRYEVHHCKVLLIDDIGCEMGTYYSYGNAIRPIQDVILSRYASRLPTVIATNLSLEHFAERYGERVADRVNEQYSTLEFSEHESYRRMLL